MAAIFGSLHNGSLPWIHDRSTFTGNATDIACAPDAPHSGPGLLLMYGTGGGCLLSFLMWVLSGLGETASGTKPMETNHVGAFILIPPFYLALGAIIGWRVVDCTLGCSAWASSAPSISFFTANIQREGYMMLFMTLTLTALIFFKRIDKMARRRYVDAAKGDAHPWSRSSLVGEWLMRCGFVLTTITGIMPSLASNCHLQPASRYERCWEEEMSNPHGAGVAAGIFLTFCGYQLRAIGPIAMHSGVEGASAYAYYTLVVSELAFLCMLVFFACWLHFLYAGGPNPRTVDVCLLHTTQSACTGEDLPPQQQRWADQRPGGWQCRWDPDTDYYRYPCTRHDCDAGGRLEGNKYSVIFEYLGFLYWAIACAGMTQAIDVMDDTPAETKMKAFVKKQRGTAAKKRAGSITPARGYTALS
mmetsp:Transcript_32133/g.95896  ORF Transcript_32133/g.95896 Transcript_32133/m.95896 type:complete len:416 (+) Transcript_32133:93-1340(+)